MLGPQPVDVDLDLKSFEERVNSHLVGQVGEHRQPHGRVPAYPFRRHARRPLRRRGHGCCGATCSRSTRASKPCTRRTNLPEVSRRFVAMADAVNGYIAAKAPWVIARDESRRDELQQVCSFAINAFRLLSGLLKPILPITVAAAEIVPRRAHRELRRCPSRVVRPYRQRLLAAVRPRSTRRRSKR